MTSERPLLLVDVDGVISLFGFDAQAPPPGRGALIDGVPHLLSHTAAAVLRRVAPAYECVWCTGWEERADEHLPWLLDLPRNWDFVALAAARGPGRGVAGHWKLAAIDAYAGPDRALAWVDDDLDETCHAWAAARPGPTLLVECDPATGLTESGGLDLAAFADGLSSRSSRTRPDAPNSPPGQAHEPPRS